MLLGAARYLAETRNFDGTVYFIFQPAEEGGAGAAKMIDEGLFADHQMETVWGMHNWPGLPSGEIAVSEGASMASADHFEMTVTGRGGHAAMPHQAIDPVWRPHTLCRPCRCWSPGTRIRRIPLFCRSPRFMVAARLMSFLMRSH